MRVYAIEARGLAPSTRPDSNIDELVSHYLSRIATVQPNGPYFLVGHSFGGMVVFEMAQRLLAANERVASLILLDVVFSKKHWPVAFYLENLEERLHRHCRRFISVSVKDNLIYYFRRVILRMYGLDRIPPNMKIGSDNARVLLAHDNLMRHWNPNFYPETITLFCCSATNNLERAWRGRARKIDVHHAVGGHVNMIDFPNVSSLAADISTCLAKASERYLDPARRKVFDDLPSTLRHAKTEFKSSATTTQSA